MAAEAGGKRYDRQIRIWGAHGQAQLEKASVCLLNASVTGSEALKNLVLGGINAFTIVDSQKVTERDLGNNFLLEKRCLGMSRAQSVTELLKELNPTVSGSFVEDTVSNVMDSHVSFFQPFQLVIASQMSQEDTRKLDAICRSQGTKLIIARVHGLAGFVRIEVVYKQKLAQISLKEHLVVESRPEHPEEDLRLDQPWPELQSWVSGFDLGKLTEAERSHVPFVVLLIQAADKWRESHGGSLPKSYQDRQEFKELIRSWQHKIDGIPIEDENFKEALENRRIFRLCSAPTIPSEVKQILDESAASTSGESSDPFWTVAAALRQFVQNEGQGKLPLEGSIPDMTAKTATFLELQRIYRERAKQDITALEGHVARIEQEMGNTRGKTSPNYIRLFAKNARNLRVLRYATLEEEASACRRKQSALSQVLEQEDTRPNAGLYLLLQAVDDFQAIHGRFPGAPDSDLEEETLALSAIFKGLLAKCGQGNGLESALNDYVAEMVRSGGSELHVIATIIGGIASQEAIKILTSQFVPLSGTFIYNGVTCTSSVFSLE